ncbi:SDR family NAD(P)-dependent oxidoreductase [Chloroflexi bacterium TSY]|nr:SDR family NAD(P)-dependent oxidoreductase [Chloroflexi bacterium TSY]
MQASGKTVLITGGGSGIGLHLAKEFLKNGSKVIICGRTVAKLEQAQKENRGLEIAQCDISDSEQIQALLDKCDREFGGIDILVNNAAVFNLFDVTEGKFTLEQQLKEIDIDFSGPVRMVHYFLPGLLNRPEAAIVNVSSGLAFVPLAAAPVYAATKAASHSWTQSLRKQLSNTNVAVFELMPPVVDTEMADVEVTEGLPKMAPAKLARQFMKGFLRNKFEMTPGLLGTLKPMSRIAPGFTFKMLNR